ncbi:MAG: hypothetical protein E7480_07555 [Ruminococcaceae bacterium]|nr:hypothetical protein [Oscillospiraceae bacterium]
MKLCDNCGAHNSDERIFCVDCNEMLGDKLSSFEEQKMRAKVSGKIEEMYNKKDPLYVSKLDKAMGAAALIGALCTLVFIIIGIITQRSFELLWVGMIFFLLASIEALIPKVMWAIEKLRLSFFISDADNAEPSGFYIFSRKATVVISVAVGIVILTVNLLGFRHPPIREYISDIANTKSVSMSSHTKDYIDANPEKWQKILSEKDYAVNLFISELEKATNTGLEEQLMIQAIMQITGKDIEYVNKDDFLFKYYSNGIEIEYSTQKIG